MFLFSEIVKVSLDFLNNAGFAWIVYEYIMSKDTHEP